VGWSEFEGAEECEEEGFYPAFVCGSAAQEKERQRGILSLKDALHDRETEPDAVVRSLIYVRFQFEYIPLGMQSVPARDVRRFPQTLGIALTASEVASHLSGLLDGCIISGISSRITTSRVQLTERYLHRLPRSLCPDAQPKSEFG
jgi:hypothetical protein